MNIFWITTQFPNGDENRDGMFVYRTLEELGKYFKITVLVLYPVVPPFLPMLKNLKDRKKIYADWKTAFPRNPKVPEYVKNLKVHYIKYLRPPRINYFDVEGWFAFYSLNKFFKKEDNLINSLIHAAWIFPAGQAAWLLSKRYNLRFVVTLMGSDVNFIKENTLRHKSAIKVINSANKVTSVSQILIQELIKKKVLFDINKTMLTHTMYNFNKFKIIDKNEMKSDIGIAENIKVIFFAAMLRKLKNADKLILSFSKLLNEDKNIILIIAGSGYEEENLKRLVQNENLGNSVKFLGNINEDLIIKYYNCADVFCLPSRNEGLPNVLVESLLCGTPVVASAVGEIPIIINNGKNGYLIKPGSVEELAEALKTAMSKNWNRFNLRKSVEFLSTENVINEYKKLYNYFETT